MRVTLVLIGDGNGPVTSGDVRAVRVPRWEPVDGEVVAYFDTRYRAGQDWCKALGTAPVVGGFVWPADGYGWAGWVYYVIEYGWKKRLAVGNAAYRGTVPRDGLGAPDGQHDPRMDVVLERPPSFSEYLRERYAFSRAWGAAHVPRAAAVLRLGLPLLVLIRTSWWRRPATLPGVIIVSAIMAWGEIAGSLCGASARVKS